MQDHWEQVYSTRSADAVSWYQPHATRSLAWISAAVGTEAAIVDVGGGASRLVDDLLGAGYRDLAVLDRAAAALQVARQRLGADGTKVRWITGDITALPLPANAFALWHDRAAFHFLTDAAARSAYVAQLRRALRPGGHLIIATFGPDGPTRCSGLPVVRYSAPALQAELGENFQLIEQAEETHRTPAGATQQFVYCHFLKTA